MSKLFKKKSEFSKSIVILEILLFIIYIVTNFIMLWKRGVTMPSDINIGVFTFLTGELGILSFIKRSKLTAEAATKTITDTVAATAQMVQQTQQKGAGYSSFFFYFDIISNIAYHFLIKLKMELKYG